MRLEIPCLASEKAGTLVRLPPLEQIRGGASCPGGRPVCPGHPKERIITQTTAPYAVKSTRHIRAGEGKKPGEDKEEKGVLGA
eukprot:8272026-Pyramimonas_sp.AAC.1